MLLLKTASRALRLHRQGLAFLLGVLLLVLSSERAIGAGYNGLPPAECRARTGEHFLQCLYGMIALQAEQIADLQGKVKAQEATIQQLQARLDERAAASEQLQGQLHQQNQVIQNLQSRPQVVPYTSFYYGYGSYSPFYYGYGSPFFGPPYYGYGGYGVGGRICLFGCY